jgi:hypothetical protein
MSTSEEWISISQYARAYGVDRSTVYKFLDAGLLDVYRVRCPGILVVRIRNTPPGRQHASTSDAVGGC